MSGTAAAVLLWLFVINLGVAFGAGVYELRIVVPTWLTSDQSGVHWRGDIARRDDVGRKFWGFVTTGPLTLITFANLYAAWYSTGAVRGPWLAAGFLETGRPALHLCLFHPGHGTADEHRRFAGGGCDSWPMADVELSASRHRVRGLDRRASRVCALLSAEHISHSFDLFSKS